MENAMVSAGYMMGATTCLVGVEEFISKETFEWMINEPLIVRASSLIARAMDDIVGHEVSTYDVYQVFFRSLYIENIEICSMLG